MQIRITRLTDDRHRLELLRADGSIETRELETRSFLLHDLVHYAIEAEAGIEDGFWGTVAAGTPMAALMPDAVNAAPPSPGLMLAESLVGPMQSVWNGRLDRNRYLEHAGTAAPFVDEAFVDAVLERLRRLWGHWRATRYRQTMELVWPPGVIHSGG